MYITQLLLLLCINIYKASGIWSITILKEVFPLLVEVGIFILPLCFNPLFSSTYITQESCLIFPYPVDTQCPSILGGICTVIRAPLCRCFSMWWHCDSLKALHALFSKDRGWDLLSGWRRAEPSPSPAIEKSKTSRDPGEISSNIIKEVVNILHWKTLLHTVMCLGKHCLHSLSHLENK